jgi:hypothetical protein
MRIYCVAYTVTGKLSPRQYTRWVDEVGGVTVFRLPTQFAKLEVLNLLNVVRILTSATLLLAED